MVLDNFYLLKGSKKSLGPRRTLCMQAPSGAVRKTVSAATAPERSAQKLVGMLSEPLQNSKDRKASENRLWKYFHTREGLLPQQENSTSNNHESHLSPMRKELSASMFKAMAFLLTQRTLLANQNLLVTLSSVSLNHCLYKTEKKGALH